MIIRSPRPESHFSIFSNAIIRDSRLSYKARGILLDLLSRPDNWRISAEGLAELGTDGRVAIMSGLKELRDLGYIVTERKQDEKGHWTTESVVYDQPKAGFPKSDNPKSDNLPVIEEPIKKNRERTGAPNGSQIKELMQAFFDNYTGEIQPARSKMAGHLQQVFNEMPFERLKQLVIKVAIDGKEVTRSTLLYAAREPKTQATPTPPKFDPAEYERPDAKPMSSEVRDAILKGIGRDIRGEQAENESE